VESVDFWSLILRGINRLAWKVLRHVPVGVWRRIFPKTTLAICYHMVSDTEIPHLKHYARLSATQFEADLIYLRNKFGFISYDEIVRRRSEGSNIRDNVVLLTFDDGFAECATVVPKILLRYQASCIFFVITDLLDNRVMFRETKASLCIDAILRSPPERTEKIVHKLGLERNLRSLSKERSRSPGFSLEVANLGSDPDPRLRPLLDWLLTISDGQVPLLDQLCDQLGIDVQGYLLKARPYLTSDQVRRLRLDGFTIGAHSQSHRLLQNLSPDETEREIVESCRIVRDLTGQQSVPFAFPYFGAGLDRTWLAQLRKSHEFVGLFFDTGGLCPDAPFVVQRIFGERSIRDSSIDSVLRKEWASRKAWRQ
jgi:peptidoglycan/xylan/chitin deacetylase (PgdA/CDA1 family)